MLELTMMYICPSCGDISAEDGDINCRACGMKMIKTDMPWYVYDETECENKMTSERRAEWQKEMRDKYAPNISPEMEQKRIDWHKELTRRHEVAVAEYKKRKGEAEANRPKPKCPTCGSENIQKIGSLERGASVLTLGLFSKKINKTFKCNNCKYTW